MLEAHPSDPRLAMSTGYDGQIILYDIEEGRVLKRCAQQMEVHVLVTTASDCRVCRHEADCGPPLLKLVADVFLSAKNQIDEAFIMCRRLDSFVYLCTGYVQ